jgi:hypothetical protein
MRISGWIIFVAVLWLLPRQEICASTKLIVQCLAKEESQLHKQKAQGALYHLNQDFLNELASTNDIALKKNYVDEICLSKKLSPSLGLLRLLLIKEGEIYDLSLSEVEVSMRPFKMGYINEFQKQVPRLFVQFISSLQAEMPTAHCLDKTIPELKVMNEKLKYLEEEMSSHDLLKDKKKIEMVFSKLENIAAIKIGCEKDKIKKEKSLKGKMKKQKNPTH